MLELKSTYKTEKKSRRRREILDGAAYVIADFGYLAASMKDIADRLDLRPGSLYYYLKSKEAALEEICWDGGVEYVEYVERLANCGAPTIEIIRSAISHHLRNEKRVYVECFVYNRRHLAGDVADGLNNVARNYLRAWFKIFEQGIAEGVLPPDLDCQFAATTALSVVNGATLVLRGKSGTEEDQYIHQTTEFFLSGLGVTECGEPAYVQK
jgi:AcrR family transcriptional regulator